MDVFNTMYVDHPRTIEIIYLVLNILTLCKNKIGCKPMLNVAIPSFEKIIFITPEMAQLILANVDPT